MKKRGPPGEESGGWPSCMRDAGIGKHRQKKGYRILSRESEELGRYVRETGYLLFDGPPREMTKRDVARLLTPCLPQKGQPSKSPPDQRGDILTTPSDRRARGGLGGAESTLNPSVRSGALGAKLSLQKSF